MVNTGVSCSRRNCNSARNIKTHSPGHDPMKTLVGLLLLSLLAVSPAHARDGFEKVRCGGDIVKALVGQRADNETVMVIEARHKDLGLKDLGALESENGWFPI